MKIPILLAAALTAGAAPPGSEPPRPSPDAPVRALVAAFNAHDVPKLLSQCAADVRWMSVDGDQVSVETNGAAELEASMRKYFQEVPSARSQLVSVVVTGRFVSTVEKASWERAGAPRHQCSVGIYELRDGKVGSVWYFPAHAC